jgi:hypothetical protein
MGSKVRFARDLQLNASAIFSPKSSDPIYEVNTNEKAKTATGQRAVSRDF